MGARTEVKRFFQRLWLQCWWQPTVAGPGVPGGGQRARSDSGWSLKVELRGLAWEAVGGREGTH